MLSIETQLTITAGIDQNVFWLQVAIRDKPLMHMSQGRNHTRAVESSIAIGNSTSPILRGVNDIEELTSLH